MTEEPSKSVLGIAQRRESVVEALTQHYAQDHLDTTSFEQRLDRVYAAKSLEDLEGVLSDLPALSDPALPARGLARPEEIRARQHILAFLGGATRKGGWTPARRVDAVALMGGLELDFREARFAPGATELNVIAIMGGVEILVPPDINVECDGIGLLGGFEAVDNRVARPDHPTLRISGLALMGGVEVSIRLPGESAKEARKRLRGERQRKGGTER